MLSRIDQIVDTTSGYGMLSFLNDFFGYHKIPMHSLDTEKTTFITPQGLYCYKVMYFGLKNAITTLIGQTVEVYIDNIVVKSKTHVEHIQHLEKAFNLMHKYNIKLNPFKCAFRVSTGKFFGFMVT